MILEQSNNNANSANLIHFQSNGFKIKGTGANINTNGSKYIFMAWADTVIGGGAGLPPTAV